MRGPITRKGVSRLLFLSFLVMAITGLLSFVTAFSKSVSALHTFFGFVFLGMALVHFGFNFKPLKQYFIARDGRLYLLVKVMLLSGLIMAGTNQAPPFDRLMALGNQLKGKRVMVWAETDEFLTYDFRGKSDGAGLQVEIKKGRHFWYPQLAVWLEDTAGKYIKTIFITNSTAKGLFYASRTKDNYKLYDGKKVEGRLATRRVNALPHWSYKRNVKYPDNFYVPPPDQPLPDGISGATPQGNLTLKSDLPEPEKFVIKLEVNVAFDENKYFSAFDYPDDSLYHSGSGLMGQPSLVYGAVVDRNDNQKYYLMTLLGHGHQSGQSGRIYTDTDMITTAKEILERIIVGLDTGK